jgi:hypothetical protein
LQKINESNDLEQYEEDQLEFGLGMNLFYYWMIYT